MKRNNIHILLAVFLVAIAASSRIVNAGLHIPNIAPLAAIGLFSGAMLRDRKVLALMVPIMGQFIADLYFQLFTNIPGFYGFSSEIFNYGALICSTALGLSMVQPKPTTSMAYVFGSSTLFFLVSNFGFFAQGWNGYSFAGLAKTYIDAIPFFKFTLAGDLAGGVLFFGGYFVIQQNLVRKAQKVKA